MKSVTCCNLDYMLNFRTIMHLDNYLDEHENVRVVLTDRVPYLDQHEDILYMTFMEAKKYLNRGGRCLEIVMSVD